ncbi:SCP2 sterol-binding domain-containing protein [Cohnella caldifontis]|uniref:SCP2 sterol-binding domain-containing protein n=1 Tax=Cohnella caldifontis TaxID=3027471 RepID=UPI0023EE0457|nr:SCP2 sterol-binding domain-containing protein [Cohnella sp. YIM B05605]
MKHLAGKSSPIDEELLNDLRPRIQSGSLIEGDAEKVFTLFGQVCNQTDEIQYEMNGMTQVFQFNLDQEVYTIAFSDGVCDVYGGTLKSPTVIFNISMQTARDIVTGNIHSSVAQMNGDIVYTGPRQEALEFQRIFELFLDLFI